MTGGQRKSEAFHVLYSCSVYMIFPAVASLTLPHGTHACHGKLIVKHTQTQIISWTVHVLWMYNTIRTGGLCYWQSFVVRSLNDKRITGCPAAGSPTIIGNLCENRVAGAHFPCSATKGEIRHYMVLIKVNGLSVQFGEETFFVATLYYGQWMRDQKGGLPLYNSEFISREI